MSGNNSWRYVLGSVYTHIGLGLGVVFTALSLGDSSKARDYFFAGALILVLGLIRFWIKRYRDARAKASRNTDRLLSGISEAMSNKKGNQ